MTQWPSTAYSLRQVAEAAMKFFNEVGELAESEGHHPDLHLTSWRNVQVDLSTHAIGGLALPDFVLAAKIDAIEAPEPLPLLPCRRRCRCRTAATLITSPIAVACHHHHAGRKQQTTIDTPPRRAVS